MPQKNTKTLTIRFELDMRQAIANAAKEQGCSDGMLVKKAVQQFLDGPVTHETATTPPAAPKLTETRVEEQQPDPEPSLVNTEKGFKLGVEAACEKVSQSKRLGVMMATGITFGEDIANRIRLDLLGADL